MLCNTPVLCISSFSERNSLNFHDICVWLEVLLTRPTTVWNTKIKSSLGSHRIISHRMISHSIQLNKWNLPVPVLFIVSFNKNCYDWKEIKPLFIERQPEILCLLPNNACFSFSWFAIKSHLMLIACVLTIK